MAFARVIIEFMRDSRNRTRSSICWRRRQASRDSAHSVCMWPPLLHIYTYIYNNSVRVSKSRNEKHRQMARDLCWWL